MVDLYSLVANRMSWYIGNLAFSTVSNWWTAVFLPRYQYKALRIKESIISRYVSWSQLIHISVYDVLARCDPPPLPHFQKSWLRPWILHKISGEQLNSDLTSFREKTSIARPQNGNTHIWLISQKRVVVSRIPLDIEKERARRQSWLLPDLWYCRLCN